MVPRQKTAGMAVTHCLQGSETLGWTLQLDHWLLIRSEYQHLQTTLEWDVCERKHHSQRRMEEDLGKLGAAPCTIIERIDPPQPRSTTNQGCPYNKSPTIWGLRPLIVENSHIGISPQIPDQVEEFPLCRASGSERGILFSCVLWGPWNSQGLQTTQSQSIWGRVWVCAFKR